MISLYIQKENLCTVLNPILYFDGCIFDEKYIFFGSEKVNIN
jgi:hypothetical protein